MAFRVCKNFTFYHNEPWFSFHNNIDDRPTVDKVYNLDNILGKKPPFQVRIGETLFFRDDGSLSLPFVRKNRILFPFYEC